jgi:hypothetical protein
MVYCVIAARVVDSTDAEVQAYRPVRRVSTKISMEGTPCIVFGDERVSLSRYIIRVRSMTSYEDAGRISQRVPATHIASEIEILY